MRKSSEILAQVVSGSCASSRQELGKSSATVAQAATLRAFSGFAVCKSSSRAGCFALASLIKRLCFAKMLLYALSDAEAV